MKVVKVNHYGSSAPYYFKVNQDINKGDILEVGKNKKTNIAIAISNSFEISEEAMEATTGLIPTANIVGVYELHLDKGDAE